MLNDEFFARFTDALPTGILAVSGQGRVFLWNSAAESITSISRNCIMGNHTDSLPVCIRDLLGNNAIELTIETAEGEFRHVRKTIREISLTDGTGNSTIVAFTDMTDHLNRKQEMEQVLMETAETRDLMEEQAAKLAMALAEVDEKSDIIQGQNRKMVDELKMAGRLQKSLLPNIYENVNGVSVSCKYIPSIHIGGDLYDVVDLGHGLTGFIIADVSGHGVAAALVSSMFKMSFHALASNVASPKILFHMLNQEFRPILSEDYITSFYLLSDSLNRSLTFSNAGHPAPLLYKKRTGEIIELDTDGFFLGMFDDGAYEEKDVTNIEQGDALLLFTDCIIETENKDRTPFGIPRLKKLFSKAIEECRGQGLIDRIEAEIRVYNARESFDDDFTVMLLEFWEQADRSNPDNEDCTSQDSGGFVEF
jgi:serine phosphatase RsbU (regulator of sigma subunit)